MSFDTRGPVYTPQRVGRFNKNKDNMAYSTIEKRKKTNGDFSYRCTIRFKKEGAIIHRESKTFSKKELARTWGKLRIDERELEGIAKKDKVVSIGELLNLYYNDHHLWENTGRTKRYVIQMLTDCEIANVLTDELKSSDLIEHCKIRKTA